MAKRKNSSTKKMGCGRWAVYVIGVILALPICGQIGQTLNVLPDGAEQTQTRVAQNATRQQRTAVSSDRQMTSTPTRTPIPTNTPGRFSTAVNLRTPSAMQTAQAQAEAADAVIADQTIAAQEEVILYASGNANLRKCAGTTGECAVIGTVAAGYELAITGEEEGQTVAGSTLWYIIEYDKQTAYIHSSLVTDRKPVVQATSRPQNNNSGSAQTAPTNPPAVEQPPSAPTEPAAPPAPARPGNCSTAVAMGLSAEQAAQWSHLDRDGDGVACYGD